MEHQPLRVVIVLSPAFSNIVLAALLEPLRVARDSHNLAISWRFATWDGGVVTSSSGMRIEPDSPLDSIGTPDPALPDLALIVGGDHFRADAGAAQVRAGLRTLRPVRLLIGADTGAWLMAAGGLLDGQAATVHWQLVDEFAETFPGVDILRTRHVTEGRYWTCGSAASALGIILHFIALRYGPAIAYDCSAMFFDGDPSRADDTGALPSLAARGSARLQRVLQLMAASVEEPLSLTELSRRARIPVRTISRLFVEELGTSPARYYQSLRLARARDLAANTDLTQLEIALRCGFATTSGLRRAARRGHVTP